MARDNLTPGPDLNPGPLQYEWMRHSVDLIQIKSVNLYTDRIFPGFSACTVHDLFFFTSQNTWFFISMPRSNSEPHKPFFFRWRYSPLWALACWKIPLHLSLSITSSLHLPTPNTWRSLSTSSLHPFLGLPLRLDPSSSWVKSFWASCPPPFSPGDPANLCFDPLFFLLYFLLYSALIVLDSS